MKKTILRKLKKKLEEHEPTFRVRVVAAVVHKGKIVAMGKNQTKTHPVAALYSKHEDAIYLHAEVDAINKAKKRLSSLEDTQLYVMRMKHDGLLGNSLPCEGCSRCISDFGILTVIYSTDDGDMKCI